MMKNTNTSEIKGLELFIEFFPRAFRDQPVVVESINKTPYAYEIILSNTFVKDNFMYAKDLDQLKAFMSVESISVSPLENQRAKVFLSRLPKNLTYNIEDVIEHVRGKDKWFLGVSERGPEYIDPRALIHTGTFGSSGFGKSSFFRFLLTQNIANFPEHANVIFDVKGTDFKHFEGVPGVLAVAKDLKEMRDQTQRLLIEMIVRLHYFQHGFERAPQSLQEYQDYRSQYDAKHLPDFKRIYLWIDESYILYEENCNSLLWDSIRTLLHRARSVGIHVMMATPMTSITSSALTQINTRFFFHVNQPNGSAAFDVFRGVIQTPAFQRNHPGQMIYFDGEKLSPNIQCPKISSEQSVYLKDYLGLAPREAIDYTSVQLPYHLTKDYTLSSYIVKGASLNQIVSIAPTERPPARYETDKEEFSFVQLYATAPPAEPLPKTVSVSIVEDEDLLEELNALIREKPKEDLSKAPQAEEKVSKKSPKTGKKKGKV